MGMSAGACLLAHLDEEDVDDDKLYENPPHVEEVELPRKGVDAERIDVDVECATGTG